MTVQAFYDEARAIAPWIVETRRALHRVPEEGFHEEKTRAIIREKLTELGVPFAAEQTWIIATVQGGRPGKTVALRADFDALPVTEPAGCPFRSEHEGWMHACGHDAHTAMLLGAAKLLMNHRDLLRGAAFDCTKIDERMQSLKLDALDAARPVVTSSFRLPQGDYFLSEVWRYGRDRLENALKNIFENGDPKMAFVLLIINPHHMRLLAAPREEMSKEEAYDRMMAHLASCQANLEQYFELTLTIKRVVPYDNLYALSRENAARTAH